MTAKQISENVHFFTTNEHRIELFFASDLHFDSKYSQRELLKKHLKHIQSKNGYAFFFGDEFDVMGTYRDPRSKAADIRPEYISSKRSYLDLVIEDAYEFFKPFKDTIAFMSYGNHETSILRNHDTDPLQRLVGLLNSSGAKIQLGGYSGYIKFIFQSNRVNVANSKLAYHHGKGGNAQRSKGILWSQIDTMLYSDADIIVSGHDHNKLHDPSNVVYYLTERGLIKHKSVDWLKLGSYKRNDTSPGIGGWEVEKGFLPKKMGGYFGTLDLKTDSKSIRSVENTFIEAR